MRRRILSSLHALLMSGAFATAGCGVELRASDPTSIRADGASGWMRVDARSMGLSFAVPPQELAAVTPLDDPDLVKTCEAAARGRTPTPAPERARDGYYRQQVCVHAGAATYFIAVIVAKSDDDVRMFEQTIGHSASRAARSAKHPVSGFEGAEWSKTGDDGVAEHWCAWIARRRFYLAYAMGKGAEFDADAQRFLASFALLDHP